MRRVLAAMAAALTLTACTTAPATPTWAATTTAGCVKPTAVAHRFGTERHPENTISGAQWAMDTAHAAWLETDLQADAKGKLVIIHDSTLDRTTNRTGYVKATDMTAARAAGLRIDGGYYVPFLWEILNRVAARAGVQVQIEWKVRPTAAQLTEFLTELDRYGMRGRVVVTSFDPGTLDLVRARPNPLKTGLLANTGDQDPATITPHAQVYSKYHPSITWDRLKRWTGAGLEVDAWTIDDLAEWRRMALEQGLVAKVVTDVPNRYRLTAVC